MDDDTRKVLIVDDRLEWLLKCTDLLTEEGYNVKTCRDAGRAIEAFRDYQPDAVLLDVMMPERSGLDVLKDIRRENPWVVVIMLSGYGDTRIVDEALRLKADHFLDKNTELGKVPPVIAKELRSKQLEIENVRLKAQKGSKVVLVRDIVGECPAMQKLKEEIRTYADSDQQVLLTGPAGVGKDHIAMAFHYESRRRDEPFKNVFCPNLPESLVESELFGHEKGAYTGADDRAEGTIEAAKGGTVLLNEFVDLPRYLQAKLLGVVDSKMYRRVGGEGKDLYTHARFIAATNADINQAVERGKLREDLVWRLGKIWLRVPPLKERGEDIITLAEHFITDECRKQGKGPFDLSERSKGILMDHDWRGNVRQLEGFIRVLVQSGREEIVEPPQTLVGGADSPPDDGNGIDLKGVLRRETERVEKREIDKALRKFDGSRKKASEYLHISYRDLLYKMKKYGLRSKY